MSTKLIFVRHGESRGNNANAFNGQKNEPLTEKGLLQAEKTAEFLDKYNIGIIYSSELTRAYDTALALSKRKNIPVIKSDKIKEIFGGKFEGVPYEVIKERYPKEYDTWINDMGNCVCPEGESVRDVLKRANDEVLNILDKHKGQTVLVVTHGLVLRALSTVWYNKDITKISDFDWMKNAAVTIVNYDENNKPDVEMYNEYKHLEDLVTGLPKGI